MCLAIPGQIVELSDEEQHTATVDVSGVRRKVNVDLLREEGLAQDDWVLIHVGFAMSKISAEQAEEQLRLLEMLGETEAALEEVQGYGAGADPFDPLGKNPFEGGSAGGNPFEEGSPGRESPENKPLEEP